jgi:hypothetical protein
MNDTIDHNRHAGLEPRRRTAASIPKTDHKAPALARPDADSNLVVDCGFRRNDASDIEEKS